MKTLYIKATTLAELTKEWGFVPALPSFSPYYIRCNKKGVVNWKKAPVYGANELVERNNVNIL